MATNENVVDQEVVGNQFDPDARREADKKLKDLKKSNMSSVFGSGAGRLSLVFVGLAFLAVLAIGAFKIFGKKGPIATPPPATNAIIAAPSAQGGDSYAVNEQEAQMRRQRNQQQADEARASGSAYIAPPVLKAEPQVDAKGTPVDATAIKGPEGPKGTPEEQRRQLNTTAQLQGAGFLAPDQAAVAEQQRRDALQVEIKKYRDTLQEKEVMPQIKAASGLGWKGDGVRVFSTSSYGLPDRTKAQPAQATPATAAAASGGAGTPLPATAKTQLFAAGDACYGTVDYGINTDNPGNVVFATVPLCKGQKNMKVVGKYDYKDQAQAVAFTFDKLAIPGKPTIPIQAIGIDDKTYSTGIADDVDTHSFRRFGMTALASFISGMGKAAQVVVGTTTTTSTGLSAQTVTVQEPMTTRRQMQIALGETGQQEGELIKRQNEAIKTTIKVNGSSKDVDRGIGIVFLSDVFEEKK